MENISSNSTVARQLATNIASALDGLGTSTAVSTDDQTTVAGNTNAQQAIQASRNASNLILGAIGTASTNLQSVATEFEAVDSAIRQGLTSLPSAKENSYSWINQ